LHAWCTREQPRRVGREGRARHTDNDQRSNMRTRRRQGWRDRLDCALLPDAFLCASIGFGLRERLDARALDRRSLHRFAFESSPLFFLARGLFALAIEADFRGAQLLEPLVFGANTRLFFLHERAQRGLHGLVVLARIALERPTRETRFRLGNNFSRYMC